MEMVFHEEEAESSMIYENRRDASASNVKRSGEDSKVHAAVPDAEDVKESSCRAAAVFLGLLCLLLLIGLMTLVSRFTKSNSKQEMAMIQLQTNYHNLTRQKDQLQTSYHNLTRQKDQLQASYKTLTKEKDQLQTNYHNLTRQKDQLQTSYHNLFLERHQLENNLTRQKDQLQTSYNQLATEKDQLQERFETLQRKLQDIEASFKKLTEQRSDLKRILNNFGGNLYRLVAVSFGLLCVFQAALNISLRLTFYTEASFKNLTEETAALKRMLNDFGWVHFSSSFYHISSTAKTWQESRDDCLQKHADLMIINSKAEQGFANQLKKRMWIGLTDSETEGTWKWVDGTPVTKSYWSSKEPNGGRSENCGEIKLYSAENSWNDGPCSISLFWICEKKFLP